MVSRKARRAGGYCEVHVLAHFFGGTDVGKRRSPSDPVESTRFNALEFFFLDFSTSLQTIRGCVAL
jgi:hypothetical protein